MGLFYYICSMAISIIDSGNYILFDDGSVQASLNKPFEFQILTSDNRIRFYNITNREGYTYNYSQITSPVSSDINDLSDIVMAYNNTIQADVALQAIQANQTNATQITKDIFFEIKKGNIAKHSSYSISGQNPDIDLAEEFVNSINALNLPTTYRIHNIVSSSANDTSAGTGARTIKITGNTANGIESEIVTMNGTTPVATTKSYDFIIEIEVETAGSVTWNVGTITATAQVDGTISISMTAAFGEEYNGAFKCPVGYTAYLFDWWGDAQNSNAGTTIDFHLWKKSNGSAWHIEKHAKSVNQGSSDFHRSFEKSPLILEAGDIFAVKALSSNNNSDVDTEFTIILVQD